MDWDMETVLSTANALIGDSWTVNPEYARGIIEFIDEMIGDAGVNESEQSQQLIMFAIKGVARR